MSPSSASARQTAARLVLSLAALLMAVTACQSGSTAVPTAQTAPPAEPSSTATRRVTPTATLVGSTSTPIPATADPFQVDARALKGREVRFWHAWDGQTARVAAELAGEFNIENIWGVRVQVSARGNAALLLRQAQQAQTPPDLVALPLDRLAQWQQDDGLVDLNEYVPHPEWGMGQDEVDDFLPVLWDASVINAVRLGIPAEQTAQVMIYNRTWARELGFTRLPSTTDEFEAQTCAAAKANNTDHIGANDGTGGWIMNRQALTVWSWWGAFGAGLNPPGAETRFRSPEAEQAMGYLRGLFEQGCAWNSRLPEPYGYFSSRNTLIYAGNLSDVEMQAGQQRREGVTDEWVALPFPAYEGETRLWLKGSYYGIPRTEEEQQLAAWLFLRWLAIPQHQARLAEAGGSLPLTATAREEMAGYAREHPQWAGVLDWLDEAGAPPAYPDWWLASSLLEDAAWQLIQPTPQPVETILEEADLLLPEVAGTASP